jgi:hypothetical protein
MITKILIDKESNLEWELQEKLIKLCNGFEVDKKELVFWVADEKEIIFQLLEKANIPYEIKECA